MFTKPFSSETFGVQVVNFSSNKPIKLTAQMTLNSQLESNFYVSISLIANSTINKATRSVNKSAYGSNHDSSILNSLRCFSRRINLLLFHLRQFFSGQVRT